jgi:hypothetical protein
MGVHKDTTYGTADTEMKHDRQKAEEKVKYNSLYDPGNAEFSRFEGAFTLQQTPKRFQNSRVRIKYPLHLFTTP